MQVIQRVKFLSNLQTFRTYLIKILLISLIYLLSFILKPQNTIALDNSRGEVIFRQHCSGCHVNGGNILRRNKTLKLKALIKNGFDSPEAIAKVAREGTGIMDGYGEILGKGNDQILANWVWEQAQNAWTQG